MREIHRVDDHVEDDGTLTTGYSWWLCDCARNNVFRYRGQSDVSCSECGAWYNASGQRLRDDWMGNMSNWDSEVSDMDGFEAQYAGDE